MPEKIGKYLIRERIGRGGMGMIFKAHDPVLDRPVAIKVISTDIEVTDELRARFFREAQACARLSHPNIVTIYDMGEDDGRLYIVMELLEGEELRHLIAHRKTPPLEDKLSIMTQVCDGLHYAHVKGIVHRDIKPANIFLQKNGQAKILDFGIAQIANTEAGLTRTGLIMGTLRYIAPEQVRGHADSRSDIYSAGAVFYELLSMRPPFIGDDPMHLLEQLRTEDPPPLDQLDPSIPAELAAITKRALSKNPAERFGDFAEMRSALEEVQREFLEEARRVGAHVREQRALFLRLRATLVERIGASMADETIPTVDERGRLAVVLALERDFERRIEALQAMIARADALAPAFERAAQLVQTGHFGDAVEEFEAIVADMPEHARALDGLRQARAHLETRRRQQLAVKLTQDARSALEVGEYTLCLEILNQAAEIPAAADATQEIAALRETAEAAMAARRARQHAEGARERMTQVRLAAQAQADTRYAASLWNEAEEKDAEAQAAFAREAYEDAGAIFDEAAAAYRRFEVAAGEARRQEEAAAEQAREQVAQARERGQAGGVPEYERGLWDAAEARSADAHAALADKAIERALGLFNEALALFGQAEEAAREARRRERQHTDELRAKMAQARERARAAGAPRHAHEQWDAAEAELSEAEHAWTRQAYAQAGRLFAAVTDTYRRLEETAREAGRRERTAAERARDQLAQARQASQVETAPDDAPTLWQEAEATGIEAEARFAREAFVEAREGYDKAAVAYRRFGEAAREARRQERDAAEQARGQLASRREQALGSAAPQYAASLWEAAEAKSAAAQAALLAESPGRAADLFTEAVALYARAERDAAHARQDAQRRAEETRERAAQGQLRANAVDAQRHAPALWSAATAKSAEGEAALTQQQWATAVERLNEALALYQRAESEACEARQRQRDQAEQARQAMAERRHSALAAAPQSHAPSDWRDAETSAESGQAALAQEAYAEAQDAFDRAAALYSRAEERARDAARALEIARADAERAREATAAARRAAAEAQAVLYAPEQWSAGESAEAQASAALTGGEHAAARSFFAEARRQYGAAAQVASIAVEAETLRADAMVSDARRLLATGDVAACLRRVKEVLTIRPGHAGAEQVRLEAEDRERQAAAVAQDAIVRADRSDAQRAQVANGLARRAAAEAQAPTYAPEQWRASEGAEAQAIGALDRHDYRAAGTLFADAERLYAAAAQAASKAQTTEARLVDEMAAEAERLLAAGEIQACLGRLGELLARRPGHAMAERLRLQVESRLREVSDEATKGETVYGGDGTDRRGRAVQMEDPTARLPAGTDETLTVLERPRVRDVPSAEKPTPRAEPPPAIAGAPSITGSATADPTVPSPSRSQTALGGVARRTVAPPWFRVRGRDMLVVLGAAIVVVLVIAYWMRQSPPWPPSDLTELAKQAVTGREGAIRASAERSAQFAHAREKELAGDAAFERRDAKTAEVRYREAVAGYQLATTGAEKARADALTAARQAGEARKKAELAEAPKRASSLWNTAETGQRDATAALESHTFDSALTLFAKVEKTYQEAEQAALRNVPVPDDERPKARTAQREAAVARDEAEGAHARGLARATFTLAQQKEDAADAILDSDPASARSGFSEALRLFKQATQEAATRRVALQRAGSEQARERMMNAQQGAEQAGATERAPVLFEWGRKKERDAGAAATRQDYVMAERLFADAQADYESAAREARKTPERIGPGQYSADQARRRMAAYRERAQKAGADRLAEGLFGRAQAKEAGADRVMNLASFDLATRGYGEAGDLYLDAGRLASERHEADVARSGMLAEKERARRNAPEYRDALAEERQGGSAYDRDKYREAAERFRTAQAFYARAATNKTAGSSSGTR